MIRIISILLLGLIVLDTQSARAWDYFSCGKVTFDCDHQVATMGNVRSPLVCGEQTPKYAAGTLRSVKPMLGKPWRCLKGKPGIDIGLGAIKVHAPCRADTLSGSNQTFAHSGCLNVSQPMVQALEHCIGSSSYEIHYASNPCDRVESGKFRCESSRIARSRKGRQQNYASNSNGYSNQTPNVLPNWSWLPWNWNANSQASNNYSNRSPSYNYQGRTRVVSEGYDNQN